MVPGSNLREFIVYVWKYLYFKLNISVVNSASASFRHHIDTQVCSHHCCSLISLYYNLLNRVETCDKPQLLINKYSRSCWMEWNLCTMLSFFRVFSCKIIFSYKLQKFGIKKKKSRNLALLLLAWSAEWLAFPVVVKIMCENWLNSVRETSELLKESKEPSTIKRTSHELCKKGQLFPKVKGKHHSALQRKEIAMSMVSNFNQPHCSQWTNHTETFCCAATHIPLKSWPGP